MSPGKRRRPSRERHPARRARLGRRFDGLTFRTAVEMLEPRRMLSAQSVSPAIVPTYRLLANSTTPADTGLTAPASNAYTPTEILTAYSYAGITFSNGTVQGNGAGQTIAIVDAYNDPGIITDAN